MITDFLDTIVCGNCLDVMSHMPDLCVDLIIVDYPYESTPNAWDRMPDGIEFIKSCERILKHDRSLVMTGKQPGLRRFTAGWDAYVSLHHEEIWVKQSGPWCSYNFPLTAHETVWWWAKGEISWDAENIGEKVAAYVSARSGKSRPAQTVSKLGASKRVRDWLYPMSVYFYDVVRSEHPTEKPLGLYERFIKVATVEGDLVFDTFSGSGTSAVAALMNGCHFYGCDISETFVAVSKERIECL